jgi:3-methyl-2-oxobutanoate hydroxymethyltransferase
VRTGRASQPVGAIHRRNEYRRVSTQIAPGDGTADPSPQKIVGLTAHSAPMATLLDPFVDLMQAEDSLGMVVHGLPTTLGVTLNMMVLHGWAVMRGSSRALVVVDLTFGSCKGSPQQAMHRRSASCARRAATPSTRGRRRCSRNHCVPGSPRHSRGGHVGLRPQAANLDGGFKAKGRSTEAREDALAEARAVDQAGAFAMVVEGVSGELAEEITRSIPTVGIGASSGCDEQILVTDDMIGMFDGTPKFVRRYGKVRHLIAQAVEAYAADVPSGAFPVPAEMYSFASAPAAQRT